MIRNLSGLCVCGAEWETRLNIQHPARSVEVGSFGAWLPVLNKESRKQGKETDTKRSAIDSYSLLPVLDLLFSALGLLFPFFILSLFHVSSSQAFAALRLRMRTFFFWHR